MNCIDGSIDMQLEYKLKWTLEHGALAYFLGECNRNLDGVSIMFKIVCVCKHNAQIMSSI